MPKNKSLMKELYQVISILFIGILAIILVIGFLFQKAFMTEGFSCGTDIKTCQTHYFKYLGYELIGKCYSYKQEQGVPSNNDIINLKIDAYSYLSKTETEHLIKSINPIWNMYGVNFSMRTYTKIEDEQNFSTNECAHLKPYAEKTVTSLYNDSIIDVIITKFSDEASRGLLGFDDCGGGKIKLVLVSDVGVDYDNRYWAFNRTWVLAHELGHILGLLDKIYSIGGFNLMTNTGCIQPQYPTVLNQEQASVVIKTAQNLKASQTYG